MHYEIGCLIEVFFSRLFCGLLDVQEKVQSCVFGMTIIPIYNLKKPMGASL